MRISSATRILIATFLLITPSPLFAAKIMLIGSGDSGNDQTMQSVLQNAGNTVTIGPAYSAYTGSDLSGYNSVLLNPIPSQWDRADMPVSGQQALLAYVNQGGGLVMGAGVADLHAYPHDFHTLQPALPAWSYGETSNSPITFTSLTSDPVMNAGLPSTFSFRAGGYNTEFLLRPNANATGFFATNQWTESFGGSGVGYGTVGWNWGGGRALMLSTLSDSLSLSNMIYARLCTSQ